MTKIISYNINGIRAAIRKGLIDWLKVTSPDIICFQEIKAFETQFDLNMFKNLGYQTYCNSCLLYTSPSPRDLVLSRMPSSA